MTQIDSEILELARSRRGPYLAALGASRDKRAGVLAVLAFDVELARIRDIVSEPMLGRIRLQWWLDVLPGVVGGRAPSHPVAQALASLGLELRALRALVEAHNFDFDEGTADVAEHLEYAQASGNALATLMLDVLEVTDADARAAAADVIAAWTVAEVLAEGRRVASDADGEALRTHTRSLLGQARARVIAKSVRRTAMAVLLLARLVERKLDDPHAPMGAGAVLSIWWGGILGRF